MLGGPAIKDHGYQDRPCGCAVDAGMFVYSTPNSM